MNHFETLEVTAQEARQHVRRLRYAVPRGQQEAMLGTLENLIAATATTAHVCRRELESLRTELAAALSRLESLEKVAPPSMPKAIQPPWDATS